VLEQGEKTHLGIQTGDTEIGDSFLSEMDFSYGVDKVFVRFSVVRMSFNAAFTSAEAGSASEEVRCGTGAGGGGVDWIESM
jgi:hypothetical protein